MEEDIKILEEMITWDSLLPNKRQTEAIENLIKGYRELEKEYERVRTGRNWLSERISSQIATPELFDKILEENYIPKSKIKDVLERYSFTEHNKCLNIPIKVLEEFMENK